MNCKYGFIESTAHILILQPMCQFRSIQTKLVNHKHEQLSYQWKSFYVLQYPTKTVYDLKETIRYWNCCKKAKQMIFHVYSNLTRHSGKLQPKF